MTAASYADWCARWGDAYPDEQSRQAAYAESRRQLRELRDAFGDGDSD